MSARTVGERLRNLPLFWQIFLPNVIVLAIAAGVLALSPASVSSPPSSGQTLGLFVALVVIVLVNLILIRRAVGPVERLTQLMARVDPLEPGQRAPTGKGSVETAQLAEVFNAMLERLETERRDSGARMLSAQERERVRLARELHDEIGQSVTGLMLELDQVAKRAPAGLDAELRETQEAARAIGDELREIVRRLRPEALDDLGLHSALVALTEQFADQTGIPIERRLGKDLPPLSAETELVLYRVAQESLTNVARHADASRVVLELADRDGAVELRVADDGVGLNGSGRGSGIQGMRERAMLVGAKLTIDAGAEPGVEVALSVPMEERP
jgi:two-component system, NarL family, sensor histidine kinase UhpB